MQKTNLHASIVNIRLIITVQRVHLRKCEEQGSEQLRLIKVNGKRLKHDLENDKSSTAKRFDFTP